GLIQQHAGIIDEVARRKIVSAVDDDVVIAKDIERVGTRGARFVRIDANRRIHAGQAFLGGLDLGPADVVRRKRDLPLEIGVIDDVEIDDAQAAHAGGAKVKSRGRAEPARADHKHLGLGQLELPLHANFGHDQMAAIALNLLLRKCAPGFGNGGRAGDDRHVILLWSSLDSQSYELDSYAAGDRRHNADRIAVLGRRVFLLQVANILVIEVDIHEAANAAVIGVKVLAEIRVSSRKLFQGFADGSRIELHACLLARKLPQGSWN